MENHNTKAPVLMESEMMVKVQECRVCHGTQEAQRGPILDGMEYWYLSEQLQKFHAGIRGQNPQNRSEYLMGVGARKINNQVEIAYLATGLQSRSQNRPFAPFRATKCWVKIV